MDSSSRRPHRVPLRSDKNSTRRIQFTQTQQNWTIDDWKNVAWSDESRFLLQHSDVGSVFGVKNMKVWIILPCLNGSDWFKHHSLPEYCCWPCPSLYDYSVPIFWCTSSRIMHRVTKIKSSQTGFLNMTMSSLYSNVLHSHQISIQQSTFGMWWNERFTSWMCGINCVMLSWQYGPTSLRNVSNTLLNLCHEELRQFWRH